MHTDEHAPKEVGLWMLMKISGLYTFIAYFFVKVGLSFFAGSTFVHVLAGLVFLGLGSALVVLLLGLVLAPDHIYGDLRKSYVYVGP